MGPESSSHKVTITPNQWHVRRSLKAVDRSLTRPEAGGFSSQTVSTSTSPTFSQGVFPQKMILLAKSREARACSDRGLPVKPRTA